MRRVQPLLEARATPSAPTLFFEFHGSAGRGRRAGGAGGRARRRTTAAADFRWATRAEDRTQLWQARHDAYYARQGAAAGRARRWATDVCVPISRLAECILETQADIEAERLLAPIVGHVGDGNFHVTFLLDPERPGEIGAGRGGQRAAWSSARSRMGGTCTGEHGIGMGKIGYPRGRARRSGRADAADQAGARPAEHPESGQGPSAGLIPTAQAPNSCRNPSRILKSGKPLSSHLPAGFQPRKAKPFQRLAPQSPGPAIFAPFHPKPRAVGQG